MKDKKDLNTTVDEFLEEEKQELEQPKEEECTTKECKMKNGSGLLERIDKKYVTNDGRMLLQD